MTELISAFLIGLVSAGHCLGMCGGLMVAAGLNSQQPSLTFFYNIGRITTYVLLGILFGFFSTLLPQNTVPFLQLVSGILLVLSALYFMGISKLINSFETVGRPLWKYIQPIAKKLLPIHSRVTAMTLGMLWGFIPCGLVYTALAFSMTLTTVYESALSMLFFGFGTLPAMIGSALMANRIRPYLYHRKTKLILSSILIIFALLIWQDAIHNIG